MNYLFTSWEGGGNVPPALEVVSKLLAAGHQVRFLSEECNRVEVEATGARFRSWQLAPNRQDKNRASQTANDWAHASPQEGLASVIRDVWCGPALAYAQDTVAELRREPADLVVTCEALFGVMVGCESLDQRFVLLSPNISLSPLPGVPPLGPGLTPAVSAEDQAMHAHIAGAIQSLIDSGLPSLNAARASLDLKPLEHVFDQFAAAHFELLATSRAFDFPCSQLPERVVYVGPQIRDPHWARDWKSPWPEGDTRPLVVVGFSTTFQNHVAILQKVIDALATLPVRVLLTLGGSVEAHELQAAENCLVVESAPHTVDMGEAALVVTHGGHGTVMRALMHRLPLLVIPHGRDQNDNAARIAHRGAGLSLPPDSSVEAICQACQNLLEEPSFREAARQLGDLVAAEAGGSQVVAVLEAAAAVSASAS
jgi:MGT family glycosyltransferase